MTTFVIRPLAARYRRQAEIHTATASRARDIKALLHKITPFRWRIRQVKDHDP